MNTDLLQLYIKKLCCLKRGNTPYGKAPHKPVLLLSLIQLMDRGKVVDNKFELNADLVGTFLDNWQRWVGTPHQADITQPFYHLQSDQVNKEAFWFLVPHEGCQINAPIKSVNILSVVLNYGCFSTTLYQLLLHPIHRQLLRQALMETYFPQAGTASFAQEEPAFLRQLEDYILNEPEVQYRTPKLVSEEEVFVRSSLFKKLVPKVYAATCSFTGMQLGSTHGHQFIDACHIVPFSISQNDQIGNGIALCPNMHRAFDRGLLSIDEDYRIMVSEQVIETQSEHPYALKHLAGKAILLPPGKVERLYPAAAHLAWHRERVFKG